MRGYATDPMALLKILLSLTYLERAVTLNPFGTVVTNDDVMYESVLLISLSMCCLMTAATWLPFLSLLSNAVVSWHFLVAVLTTGRANSTTGPT